MDLDLSDCAGCVERAAGQEACGKTEGRDPCAGHLAGQGCTHVHGNAAPSSPVPTGSLQGLCLQTALLCRASIHHQGVMYGTGSTAKLGLTCTPG